MGVRGGAMRQMERVCGCKGKTDGEGLGDRVELVDYNMELGGWKGYVPKVRWLSDLFKCQRDEVNKSLRQPSLIYLYYDPNLNCCYEEMQERDR